MSAAAILAIPLGARSTIHCQRPGATLIGFTDGVVERRGEDIDVGMERLRSRVEQAPTAASAEELRSYVVDHLDQSEDDAALLVLRNVGAY